MKKSRYTDSQILAILKQAEAGTPVPDLCREHGMSSASFYGYLQNVVGMALLIRMAPTPVLCNIWLAGGFSSSTDSCKLGLG